MDNKLREIEEFYTVQTELNYPVETVKRDVTYLFDTIMRLTQENQRLKTAHHDMSDDWVRMLKERNDAIDLLTEERDVYKKGYYKDADAVTLTVVSRLESEAKRLTEENESLNKRYLEEFEKKHD